MGNRGLPSALGTWQSSKNTLQSVYQVPTSAYLTCQRFRWQIALCQVFCAECIIFAEFFELYTRQRACLRVSEILHSAKHQALSKQAVSDSDRQKGKNI